MKTKTILILLLIVCAGIIAQFGLTPFRWIDVGTPDDSLVYDIKVAVAPLNFSTVTARYPLWQITTVTSRWDGGKMKLFQLPFTRWYMVKVVYVVLILGPVLLLGVWLVGKGGRWIFESGDDLYGAAVRKETRRREKEEKRLAREK